MKDKAPKTERIAKILLENIVEMFAMEANEFIEHKIHTLEMLDKEQKANLKKIVIHNLNNKH